MPTHSMRATRFVRAGRSIRSVEFLGLLLFAAGMSACTTNPIPLSAQAGSTFVVPLMGAGGSTVIGFGGSEYTDYQRGEMVYWLDDTDPELGGIGGFPLDTRLSLPASAHPASKIALQGVLFASPPQILSIVDIPADAPEGTHSLHIVRELPNGDKFPGPIYPLGIKILPNSIDTTDQSETIVGAITPSGNTQGNTDFSQAIPRPRILILISGGNDAVSAFEFDLTYPSNLIDVVDAFQAASFGNPANKAALVWIDDDGAGLVHVSGVAHPDFAGAAFFPRHIDVVFVLDEGNTVPLDVANVSVSPPTAYDLDGILIPGATATINGIH